MARARVSNETLAKTLSSTIFDLKEELKKDRAHRELTEQQIRKQSYRIEEATSHFKPDLSDLNNSMRNYIVEIEKSSQQVKNSYLTGKSILIYFGSLLLFGVLSYFFLHQQSSKTEELRKQRDEVQAQRDYYREFILDSKERMADFKKWGE
jgi:hypothetical protein